MKLVVDGFGKSVAKRDNQIVIKENGKEVDYFRAEDVSQILLTGKGKITLTIEGVKENGESVSENPVSQ